MFAILNSESRILRVVDCPEAMLAGQHSINETTFELTAEQADLALSQDCRIIDGEVVPITSTSQTREDDLPSLFMLTTLLRESDWSQLPDAPLTASQVTEWRTYRSELRALRNSPSWPGNITWPEPPTSTEF